jgi:hypothetical protein
MNLYAGQLSWTDPSGPMGQVATPSSVANQAAFALLYAEVLGLSDEPGAAIGSQIELSFPPQGSTWPVAAGGPLAGSLPFDYRPAHLNLPVHFSNNSVTSPIVDPNTTLPASSAGVAREQLAGWMDAHALARSSHRCALFFRQGMEAAGLSTADRPSSGDAADYGPFLLRHGARVVPRDGYAPQIGDTVVFDRTAQHPFGHIETYDGDHWVSDFSQHRFSPYSDAANTPPFTIYRIT